MSLVEFISLLEFAVLQLREGAGNCCVLSFSSRRHLALNENNFIADIFFTFLMSNYLKSLILFLQYYLLFENHTWIRASGSPILTANLSRANTL